jgi:hypothetical protein
MRSEWGAGDDWDSGFDWYTFTCAACGELTYVGRDLAQSVEDFALMCWWLYGDPPECSACQSARGL